MIAFARKLTDQEVLEIRKEYKAFVGAKNSTNVMELAQRYGVAQDTIRKIAKGKTYKWVE